MSETTDNLVLEQLRAMRAKQDDQDYKLDLILQRVSSVEKHLAVLQDDFTHMTHRMDRFDDRLKRIETRLEIVGEPV